MASCLKRTKLRKLLGVGVGVGDLLALMVGRVAVVTGGNKGIGYRIADSLVRSGLFGAVVIGCRDETRGQTAARELGCDFLQLELGNAASTASFASVLEQRYGRLDALVNNAAIAFKGEDPTPFEQQTAPTLDINYRGTRAVTEALLPLLRKGEDPRLVNVASMAGRLGQVQPPLQAKLSSTSLTLPALDALVNQFESDVQAGTHTRNGWGNSNYGFSKLAVVAATNVLARENPGIKVNCCCPGYCDTDMTSHRGPRSAADGAQNAVILVTTPAAQTPTGVFVRDLKPASW